MMLHHLCHCTIAPLWWRKKIGSTSAKFFTFPQCLSFECIINMQTVWLNALWDGSWLEVVASGLINAKIKWLLGRLTFAHTSFLGQEQQQQPLNHSVSISISISIFQLALHRQRAINGNVSHYSTWLRDLNAMELPFCGGAPPITTLTAPTLHRGGRGPPPHYVMNERRLLHEVLMQTPEP